MSVTPLGVSSGPRERSAQPHELSTSTELRVVRQPPSGVSRRREALAVAVPTLLLGLAVALVDGLTLLPLACAVLCAGLAGCGPRSRARAHRPHAGPASSATAGLRPRPRRGRGRRAGVAPDVRWGLAVVATSLVASAALRFLRVPEGSMRRVVLVGAREDIGPTPPPYATPVCSSPAASSSTRCPPARPTPRWASRLGQPRHRRGDGVLGRGRRGLRAARPRRRQRGRPPGLRSARSRDPVAVAVVCPVASVSGHRMRPTVVGAPRCSASTRPALGGRAAGQRRSSTGSARGLMLFVAARPGPPDAGHPRGQPWAGDLHADPGGPRRGAVPDVRVRSMTSTPSHEAGPHRGERGRRGAVQDSSRPPDHPPRLLAAPLVARRAAPAGQRGPGRDVAGRAASGAARRGRAVRRHRASPAGVKPGITGLWQVSGRSDLGWEESLQLDIYYAENWRLRDDLVIAARTVTAVLLARGAY